VIFVFSFGGSMTYHNGATGLDSKPIAHGLLVLSIASGLGLNSPPMRTLAFLNLREWYFRAAVFIGDTIHLHTKVLEKEVRARGRRGVITWQRQILNQAGKIVQEGISRTLVEGRVGAKDGDVEETEIEDQNASS
jgi:3-hydroxybutyryl-CoA dehydratase